MVRSEALSHPYLMREHPSASSFRFGVLTLTVVRQCRRGLRVTSSRSKERRRLCKRGRSAITFDLPIDLSCSELALMRAGCDGQSAPCVLHATGLAVKCCKAAVLDQLADR
mmetsp:Transcript_43120/g.99904  ORF Transcript_43120/g.99904 Transcript_43120/m.99904 type:complete len:111 (+) Transcript_43120:33-365(+)